MRDAAAKKPEFAEALKAYDNIAKAQKVRAELIKPYSMLEGAPRLIRSFSGSPALWSGRRRKG